MLEAYHVFTLSMVDKRYKNYFWYYIVRNITDYYLETSSSHGVPPDESGRLSITRHLRQFAVAVGDQSIDDNGVYDDVSRRTLVQNSRLSEHSTTNGFFFLFQQQQQHRRRVHKDLNPRDWSLQEEVQLAAYVIELIGDPHI